MKTKSCITGITQTDTVTLSVDGSDSERVTCEAAAAAAAAVIFFLDEIHLVGETLSQLSSAQYSLRRKKCTEK